MTTVYIAPELSVMNMENCATIADMPEDAVIEEAEPLPKLAAAIEAIEAVPLPDFDADSDEPESLSEFGDDIEEAAPLPELDVMAEADFIMIPTTSGDVESSDSDADSDGDERHSTHFVMHSLSFRDIIQGWSTSHKKITRESLDVLLKDLHKHKPEINYDKLPRSGKTLTRATAAMREEMAKYPV
jgi:U3 small nucleolar RNA-associated protein 14